MKKIKKNTFSNFLKKHFLYNHIECLNKSFIEKFMKSSISIMSSNKHKIIGNKKK